MDTYFAEMFCETSRQNCDFFFKFIFATLSRFSKIINSPCSRATWHFVSTYQTSFNLILPPSNKFVSLKIKDYYCQLTFSNFCHNNTLNGCYWLLKTWKHFPVFADERKGKAYITCSLQNNESCKVVKNSLNLWESKLFLQFRNAMDISMIAFYINQTFKTCLTQVLLRFLELECRKSHPNLI